MNIALIGPYFASSGTTRHVTNIFNGLFAIHDDNVFLFTFREFNESSYTSELNANIFLFDKIPSPTIFDEFADFISEKVIEHQIHVLLPQIKPFILLITSLVKSKLRDKGYTIRVVGTWHSNFSWIVSAPYHLAMSKLGIKICDGIIPVSKDVETSLQNILNYPQTKILDIIPPGGIDFENINIERPESLFDLKNRFDINDDYIIFLGRLLYNKGLDTLISAFSGFKFNGSLVIIGSGPFENELREQINKLGLEKRIIFTKFIEDEDVYALLQGAKLYCLPSRWESFSISTLEAMGSGIPVVCSNVGGLGMWAKEAALLIDPDDEIQLIEAVNNILQHEKLSNELRSKSTLLAKKFDYQVISQKTIDVISSHIKTLDENKITMDEDSEFEFNTKTGEITINEVDQSPIVEKNMKITDYALYYPSEALENETKNVDNKLKYYLID